MPPVELALRTGAAAILLLTGVVILRDRRRMDSKGAGGLLALSVAADSIVAVSGGPSVPGVWPLVLIAMGIPAMLWIWVGAGFVDDFLPSWRDGVAWALLPAVGALGYVIGWRPWMKVTFDVVSLIFIALAAWRAVAGLRGDLVERRRRLRPVLAILTVLYAGGLLASQALDARGAGAGARRADHTIEAALLAALAMAFGVLALRAGRPLFAAPVPEMQELPVDPPVAVAVAAQGIDDVGLEELDHAGVVAARAMDPGEFQCHCGLLFLIRLVIEEQFLDADFLFHRRLRNMPGVVGDHAIHLGNQFVKPAVA